ncbi:MAG: hypothetical protein KJ052_00850, partial [Candidatus Hydrogenedentes bacterium]|nr:hypothetical protein [Candidatus Hydrogenedentota bacterium]
MIAKMERVEIVCLRTILRDVVAFLQNQGLVHIEEVPLALENHPEYLRRVHLGPEEQSELDFITELERTLREVLPLLAKYPAHRELAAAAKQVQALNRDEWHELAREQSRELRGLTRHKISIQDNIEVLGTFGQTLQQLAPLLHDSKVVLGKDARAFVLKGDVNTALEALRESLDEQVGAEARLLERRVSRSMAVAVVTYPEGHNETIGGILEARGISTLDVPDKSLKGMGFSEVLQKIDKTLDSQRKELAEISRQLEEFSARHGAKLRALHEAVADELARLRTVVNFAQSTMVSVIHGWIPSDALPRFRDEMDSLFQGQVMIGTLSVEEVESTRVPTLLRNPKWLKPFEVLLSLFRPATYGTYDPTWLVALSFILFYGFIMGDFGYGAAVILFASWLRMKWGYNPTVKAASTIGLYMGASAIIFGLLFGEFMGDLGTRFGLHPIWFHRGHEPDTLMLWAILFGAIHVPLALLMGIREDLRHHHKTHAIEKMGLLCGLISVGLAVMGYAKVPVFNSMPVQV